MNEMNISSTRRRATKPRPTQDTRGTPSRPISLRAASPLTSQTPHGSAILPTIPTGEGWLYCAVVKDLYKSRSSATSSPTASTQISLLAAPWQGVRRRKPPCPASYFHPDRGRPIRRLRLPSASAPASASGKSMSRNGAIPMITPWLKNFFSCPQCECVHLRHFASRAQAMADVFALYPRLSIRCARIPLLAIDVLRMPCAMPCLGIPPPGVIRQDILRFFLFFFIFTVHETGKGIDIGNRKILSNILSVGAILKRLADC